MYNRCSTCDCELPSNKYGKCHQCVQVWSADYSADNKIRNSYAAPDTQVRDTTYMQPLPVQSLPCNVKRANAPRILMDHQRAIQCKHQSCQDTTYDRRLHYISYIVKAANAPTHCPSCASTHIQSDVLSYSDTLCLRFNKFKRVLAIALINELNNQNSVRAPHAQLIVEDIIRMAHIPTSTGVCPLHVVCRACAATFTILRTRPTATVPPTYCIWCGSSDVTVSQLNTEQTWNIVTQQEQDLQQLATHYSLSLTLLQALYDDWESQSSLQFFAQYMESDDVKLVRTLASRTKQTAQLAPVQLGVSA